MKTWKQFLETLKDDYWQNASGKGVRNITPHHPHDLGSIYDRTQPLSYQKPTKPQIEPPPESGEEMRMAGESDEELLARVGPKVFTQITGKLPQGMQPQASAVRQVPRNVSAADYDALGQGEVIQKPQQKKGWFSGMFGKK